MFAALNSNVFDKFGFNLDPLIDLYVHNVKRKKKTWTSVKNNYFFSCKLSLENHVIVCNSKGNNNFTFKPPIQTVA